MRLRESQDFLGDELFAAFDALELATEQVKRPDTGVASQSRDPFLTLTKYRHFVIEAKPKRTFLRARRAQIALAALLPKITDGDDAGVTREHVFKTQLAIAKNASGRELADPTQTFRDDYLGGARLKLEESKEGRAALEAVSTLLRIDPEAMAYHEYVEQEFSRAAAINKEIEEHRRAALRALEILSTAAHYTGSLEVLRFRVPGKGRQDLPNVTRLVCLIEGGDFDLRLSSSAHTFFSEYEVLPQAEAAIQAVHAYVNFVPNYRTHLQLLSRVETDFGEPISHERVFIHARTHIEVLKSSKIEEVQKIVHEIISLMDGDNPIDWRDLSPLRSALIAEKTLIGADGEDLLRIYEAEHLLERWEYNEAGREDHPNIVEEDAPEQLSHSNRVKLSAVVVWVASHHRSHFSARAFTKIAHTRIGSLSIAVRHCQHLVAE